MNVGVARKVGLPGFYSVRAGCCPGPGLDAGLLDRDPDAFHARVRAAYAAADRAVHDELIRSRTGLEAGSGPTLAVPRIPSIETGCRPPKGRPDVARPTRAAMPNLLKAIAAIARRTRFDPGGLLERDCSVARPEEHSRQQASSLIDTLKSMNGE